MPDDGKQLALVSRQRLSALVMLLVVAAATPVLVVELSFGLLISLIAVTLGSVFWLDPRDRAILPGWAIQCGVVMATVWACIEFWMFDLLPEGVIGRWMVGVVIFKCLGQKGNRDYGQLLVLACLLLVVHSRLSATLLFPLTIILFMTLGTYVVSLFHLQREVEHWSSRGVVVGADGSEASAHSVRRGLSRSTGVFAACALAVAAVVFMMAPRLGAGVLGRSRTPRGSTATGFGDTIEFGQLRSRIQRSRVLVMQVVLRKNGEPFGGPDFEPYFRGQTLETYERVHLRRWRWRWRHRPQYRRQIGDIASNEPVEIVELPEGEDPANLLEQEFTLVRVDRHQPLFTMYPPVRFRSRDFEQIEHEWSSQILTGRPKERRVSRYTVYTPWDFSPALQQVLKAGQKSVRSRGSRYAPKSSLPVSDKVRSYIEQYAVLDAVDRSNPAAVAEALETYFRHGDFEYTLELADIDRSVEPIEDFLLSRRRGHCEYFASSMAVLGRLEGLRTRVVTGYRGGEYNTVGGFYEVRENHAHAWVEVFLPETGWTLYDPTPPATETEVAKAPWWTPIATYFGFLEFKWISLVLAYDTDARNRFFDTVRSRLATVGSWAENPFAAALDASVDAERLTGFAAARGALIVMVGVAVAYILLSRIPRRLRSWFVGLFRRRRGKSAGAQRHPDAAFYDEFVRAVRRLGCTRAVHQTPLEFAAEVSRRFGGAIRAEGIADALYRIEYGGKPLPADQQQSIAQTLDAVRQLGARR